MAWQQRVTAWTLANERTIDLALVAVFLIGGIVSARFVPIEGSELEADFFAYGLIAVVSATLWWRRTRPLVALGIGVVFMMSYWVRDYTGILSGALWILFYSATRHGGPDRRRIWQVVGVALTVILVTATIGVIIPTEDLPFVAIIGIFIIHGAAAMAGEAFYQRSQYVSELEQRAEALRADLATQGQLAAVEERTRIAREMHDIIAHGMSAIVVQAQGAQRLVDTDPTRAKDVLGTIASIGRDSSNEMRRMLGVLRSDDGAGATRSPQPAIEDIDQLIARADEAGVSTSVDVVGETRPLPPGVELAAFRVVQESLTNVIRHAGRPVAAEITISYLDGSVEIAVADDGLGAAASPRTAGTGHGLMGMRERVDVYEGSFHSGPRAGGGFEVRATIPTPIGSTPELGDVAEQAGS